MGDVEGILDDVREHLEAAAEALGGGAVGGARDRLVAHVAGEVEAQLAAMPAEAPPGHEKALATARQHAHLLLDVLRGTELKPEFGLRLLHHMLEEHRRGILPAAERRFTVGSLIRGGNP